MTTTTTAPEGEAILYVDPDDIVPDPDNPRGKLRDVDAMANSIALWGVLEPITVRYVGNGSKSSAQTLMVVRGHRRHAGAQKAKAAGHDKAKAIPCRLAGAEGADDAARAVTRLVENLHRDDFNPAEEARGVQQLLDLGLDAKAIADELALPQERIDGAITIASSKTTVAVVDKHNLSFDQALAVAEFSSNKEAVKLLTVTAVGEPDEFAHVLEGLRQDRDEAIALAEGEKKWKAMGYAIAEALPSYDDKKAARLTHLVDAKGKTLTHATHKECPGRAVVLGTDYRGELIEHEICTDAPANGHKRSSAAGGSSSNGSRQSGPEKSEKEREADSLQRRTHNAAIKAGRAAEVVRRDFVRTLVQRKTVPSGMLTFAAEAILGHHINDEDAILRDLTGQKPSTQPSYMQTPYVAQQAFLKKVGAKVAIALFARVAAHVEAGWEPRSWGDSKNELRKAYLKHLIACGYQPALVEKVFLGQAKAPAILDEAARLKAATKAEKAESTK